jgi:hypothetical protein
MHLPKRLGLPILLMFTLLAMTAPSLVGCACGGLVVWVHLVPAQCTPPPPLPTATVTLTATPLLASPSATSATP